MPAPVFQSLFFPELYYSPCPPRKSFSPRFDVRETANEYIVEGELPGVPDKSDISVEFTDKGNLIVKGRVDRSRTTPTVEDVPDEDDWMGIVESSTEKPRAEGEAAKVEKPAEKREQPRCRVTKREEWPKRLLSERSVGEFARSFSFPAGIDHGAVTASLQHGVLRIVVPKRVSGVGKRIEVQ
ncbi:HSP20-like chaperone [Tuber borchii]|uniref:HSP20-like chaperone n=1 Tax=Tuber borchii TaxID=42251 RepID=A0A2T6ZQK6_TUBBO|nr:HSP20-like chaperone [Tuber borchii]